MVVHGWGIPFHPPRAFVTSAVSTLALFRQFVSSSRETAVRWKLEFSTSHRARRTSLKFASESVTLMDPNVRKGRLRWKRIASGTQRTLWNTGNSKGYRALCSGKGGRGVRMWSLVATHQGRELTARGRRRKIIKSDRGARGERKREHLEISERYPTNYFSPVVCCLKGQDTRHIARDGGKEKGGRREVEWKSVQADPSLPTRTVACKSSLVHFLLSSTLFRHYSSPRTISNPDRRRLPSLFLLFMVKFIGSSALLPFPLGGKRIRWKETDKIEEQYVGWIRLVSMSIF